MLIISKVNTFHGGDSYAKWFTLVERDPSNSSLCKGVRQNYSGDLISWSLGVSVFCG